MPPTDPTQQQHQQRQQHQMPPPPTAPSDALAHLYGVDPSDPTSRAKAIRSALMGAACSTVLIPAIFYLSFGEIGPLGWGLTIFLVVYFLLVALALHFRLKSEYHSPVAMKGGVLDRIGAFWLIACLFGPFLGWSATTAIPITAGSWRWAYGIRFFFAVVLPTATALPLLRYARGKAARVALPLLLIVTMLPVLSAVNVGRDLLAGPGQGQLKYTQRTLKR